jgi:nucleotide-binding universal stress UspA family protein
MSKIIACVDGSVYTDSVIDHAAWAGARLSASVEVLQVLGRREVSSSDLSGSIAADAQKHLLDELAGLDAQRAKLIQKRARVLLDAAKTRLDAAGIAEVIGTLRHGDLLETLAEREASADLIVIGKRGEAADFAKLHLGSNLERVVRASHKPVMVTSRAFKPISSLLVAYDGGSVSEQLIDHVAKSPLYAGLDCQVVMVGEEAGHLRHKLEQVATSLTQAGIPARARFETGTPEAVIAGIVANEGIGLLAMGAYRHSRIRYLMIGSVTTEMIRQCRIPIVLVR